MLPVNYLRNTRRVIVHGNCPDGRASAVILHAALPDAEVIEMVHNSAEHRALQPAGDVLFCDFTPWLPENHLDRDAVLAGWIASGACVLDHHRGAEQVVRAFGDRGVFADEVTEPGVSGAVLAFELWFETTKRTIVADYGPMGNLAHLVGIRDTWQHSSPDWQRACEVSEVLRFLPLDECLKRGPSGIMATAADIGPLLWAKKQRAAQEAAKTALRTTIAGRRVAIISSKALTEDAADIIDDVDIVAGFDYAHTTEGVDLVWSLRSRNGTDVRAIAEANGGNGHTSAGFKVPILESGRVRIHGPDSPYVIAETVLARGAP